MRGILSYGAYLPYRRLDRTTIRAVAGTGGGTGTRTVASYDEDPTTMGVEAARLALRAKPDLAPAGLIFSTPSPPYLDKTNATAVHAALRLPDPVPAFDAVGAVRSGVGALRSALATDDPTLVVTADVRTGLAGSADEAAGGDGAAALLAGGGPVLAEFLGAGSATAEFLERWRTPGDIRSRTWEEKFGETQYVPLGQQAWDDALKRAGLAAGQIDRVVISGLHARAAKALGRKLGTATEALVDDHTDVVGNPGAAQPGMLLSGALDEAAPDQVIALVVLADGADVLVFRTTAALAAYQPVRPLRGQLDDGGSVSYGQYLSWRGLLPIEPPRRPEPARPSASAAARGEEWKFAFVGSRDRTSGAVHLPPARVSMEGGAIDDMDPAPMADVHGSVATYTIDRLAYSPSPPTIFAVVDFDGGGRLPVELTDCEPDEVTIGDRVEMTFRRLFTADGIHNYFWKARLLRG